MRVEVARFGSLTEAQIAAGYLRSHGVAAEVMDEATGSMAPDLIFALGWFRISAPKAEAAQAKVLLSSVDRSTPAVTPQPMSPADRLMTALTFLAGLATGVPFVRKRWRRAL